MYLCVSQSRNISNFKITAFHAAKVFLTALFTSRLFYYHSAVKAVSFRSNVVILIAMRTSVTRIVSITLICAIRINNVSHVAVAESRNFCIRGIFASRTIHVSIPSLFCTARFLCRMMHLVVSESRSFFVRRVVASCTAVVGVKAALSASGSLCIVMYLVVSESRNFRIRGIFASRAIHISIPACFGTAGFLCGMMHLVVSESIYVAICIAVCTMAGISRVALRGAGRRSYLRSVAMSDCGKLHVGCKVTA